MKTAPAIAVTSLPNPSLSATNQAVAVTSRWHMHTGGRLVGCICFCKKLTFMEWSKVLTRFPLTRRCAKAARLWTNRAKEPRWLALRLHWWRAYSVEALLRHPCAERASEGRKVGYARARTQPALRFFRTYVLYVLVHP